MDWPPTMYNVLVRADGETGGRLGRYPGGYATGVAAGLMDRLLGLERVSWSDRGAVLGWDHALPAWAWVLMIVGAAVVSGWAYRHMAGPRRARVVLTVLRTVLVVFVAALLVGPRLVLTQEQVEPDWLVMLVDRSASMQIQDVRGTDAGASDQPPISRDTAWKQAMVRHAGLFGPEKLGREHQILWLGFDAGVYEMDPPYLDPEQIPRAEGQSTAVSTAIEQVLARTEGRPIGGVVLISDGRSPQSTGADLLRQLSQRAASVFCVPMGATSPPPDLSVARVEAPSRGFVNDTVPVTVWVDQFPAHAQIDPSHVRVRLVDAQTDQTLDEITPDQIGLDHPLRLTGQSAITGPTTWRVELTYSPPDGVNGQGASANRELVTHNNQQPVRLELIDRPIRVLYVEGYPRWEYRYLKNALIREKSIESSMMLISADRDFAQEGDDPITRLPRDAAEMQAYDVVIIGDVSADYFTPEQMLLIRDHVAKAGAGLLWIAGPSDCPRGYDATALVDLLPMRRPALTQRLNPGQGPLSMTPTPMAQALNVMRLATPQDVTTSASEAWPGGLPALAWVQDLRPLKPSAEVLAEGASPRVSAVPIVVRMRYGAGQSLYVATDETWRWRYGRGDLYFERFWVQLIRLLARQRVQEGSRRVWLSVSHRQIKLGQAVVVELHINDASLLPQQPQQIQITASPAPAPAPGNSPGDASGKTPGPRRQDTVQLQLNAQSTDSRWSRQADDPQAPVLNAEGLRPADAATGTRVYRTVWQPTQAGRFTLGVVEGGLDDLDVTASVEVVHPDDEWRQPLPDHDRLAFLAGETGGKVIPLDHLEDLATVVPNRARRTPNDIHEPLWDSPLSLVVVLVLLTIEWVGRKIIRLA